MVKVFAYGSNLCVERLRARTPSARVVAVGTIAGHDLRWHKKSLSDGSGKCDAYATGREEDLVWGVVYELTLDEKLVLDGFEGLGVDYFEKVVRVQPREDAAAEPVEAIAYVANMEHSDPGVRPWTWYRGFVVTGARQHRFPPEYLARLEACPAMDDPDPARHAREWAVLSKALAALRS